MVDLKSEEGAAFGYSIPLFWNREADELPNKGWDWAEAILPNVMIGLGVDVPEAYRGRGIGTFAIGAMKEIARRNSLNRLFLLVHPTMKTKHPQVSMERYVTWADESGMPFDPWLRTHIRLGGKILQVCSECITITGSRFSFVRYFEKIND